MFRNASAAAICLFAFSAATHAVSAQHTPETPSTQNPGEKVAPGPSLPAGDVQTSPAGIVHAGQTLFMSKCFQCHSVTEGEVRFGPSLYHELKKPKPKKTEAEVRIIITNGKNKMPAWGAILSTADLDHIVAYLRTL